MTLVTLIKKQYWRSREQLKVLFKRACALYLDYGDQIRVLFTFWRLPNSNSTALKGTGEKRALFISYYTSPYQSQYGTQRTAKYIKYLSKLGWRATLITTSPSTTEEDKNAETLPEEVDIIRIDRHEPRALHGQHQLVPDDFIRWVLPAVETAEEILRQQPHSIVYATAPPYSNLLAGAIVAKRAGLPLISDFRDPWSLIDTGWVVNGIFRRRLNEMLERRITRISDRVVMADQKEYWGEYFLDHSNDLHNKLISITNGFDDDDFTGICETPLKTSHTQFSISYVGRLYDHETIYNIIAPLEIWAKAYPGDIKHVRFVYAGPPPSKYFTDAITRLGCDLKEHGYVSHRNAIAIRAHSNIQMFAQPIQFKAHVASGKIYEMIRVGVPIIARTRADGAVAKLLGETKTGYAVPQEDHGEAARLLRMEFNRWREGNPKPEPDKKRIEKYSRAQLANKLDEVFREIIE